MGGADHADPPPLGLPGSKRLLLWREAQIAFNPGFTPYQFTSDTDILAAAQSGEITISLTDEVYPLLGGGAQEVIQKAADEQSAASCFSALQRFSAYPMAGTRGKCVMASCTSASGYS